MAAGDAHHDKIVNGLAGPLDPQEFERCMGDLLRKDFPGLVPVVGGSDSGFDARIPDGDGEPYPLACTTSEGLAAIKSNILRSLSSARKCAWFRGKIALAVRARLTPGEQTSLFDLVASQGASLTQVFDRDAIADRLYDRPDWCSRLLRLPAIHRALSVLPEGARAVRPAELVGRDDDLDWLRATGGDRLVHGQPGAGKTFLVEQLVAEGGVYFLRESSPELLASNLLELTPVKAVIVDDAHVHVDRLALLQRLRSEEGHCFDIIATCWPREVDEIRRQMGGLDSRHVRELELLTRDEIVRLLESLGVRAHPDVMRGLVTQAANRPGLAAIIARSWLAGDVEDVWNGEVLRRELAVRFGRNVASSAGDVLAAFAIGGDAGMAVAAVARCLGEGEGEIRRAAVALRAGGVLTEVGPSQLSVRPDVLRSALIRRAFFEQDGALVSPDDLLREAPRFDDAVLEIVRCALRGSGAAKKGLRELVERAHETAPRSLRIWQAAALIDEETATWVLAHHEGREVDVARETLEWAPAPTIAALLKAAESASDHIGSALDHPLHILSEWCRRREHREATEALTRRRLLVSSVLRYVASGGECGVALHAAFLGFHPGVENHHRDPGLGRTITLRWEILPGPVLAELEVLWTEIRPLVAAFPDQAWGHVSSLLWSCVHPDAIHPAPVSEESRAGLRRLGATIVRDVAAMTDGHPGIAARLAAFAVDLGVELPLAIDPAFETLFPVRDDADVTEPDRSGIERLAAEWLGLPPADVVANVSRYQREQRFVTQGRDDLLPDLCRAIAGQAADPEPWIGAIFAMDPSSPILFPLVSRLVQEEHSCVPEVLERCLDAWALARSLPWIGVDGVLRARDMPDHLLDRALNEAERFPDLVETLCSRGSVRIETVSRLLRSERALIRVAAVVGEWLLAPRGQVRETLTEDWRSAVLRTGLSDLEELRHSSSLEHWLGEILRSRPTLSVEWLGRLLPGARGWLRVDGPVADAIDGLSREQRVSLLPFVAALELTFDPHEIPARVVGNDPVVYRELLATRPRASVLLAPLRDPTRAEWIELARSAVAAGYSPRRIVVASLEVSELLGDDRPRLIRCRDAFDLLVTSTNPESAELGREGRRIVEERLAEATAAIGRQALDGL